MLDETHRQTTPAGRDREPMSWPNRTGGRVGHARDDAQALALLVTVILGYATTLDRSAPQKAEAVGIGPAVLAFTLLFWLYLVSRVIVASAILNSTLAQEGRPTPEEALGA